MLEDWLGPLRAAVFIVDDDAAWQRSMRKTLRELGVRRVYAVDSREDVEDLLASFDSCVVLTDLRLGNDALGGLSIVDMAHRLGMPAAIIAGSRPTRLEHLRAVSFLSKMEVNSDSIRTLLRRLEQRLAGSARVLE
ncbi:MAG TPA: hypothetical protein VF881_03605 [Polyangiaceae bacterium]